jgi:hypothetical protein
MPNQAEARFILQDALCAISSIYSNQDNSRTTGKVIITFGFYQALSSQSV